METSELVLERKLRRQADRQGLKLCKSRARDQRNPTHGTYMLVDPFRNAAIFYNFCGSGGYGLSLADVHEYLTGSGEVS